MEACSRAERQSRVRPRGVAVLDRQATVLGVLVGLAVSAQLGAQALDASLVLGTAVLLWVVPPIVIVAIVLAHLALSAASS